MLKIFTSLLLLLALTHCGVKGQLYLPDDGNKASIAHESNS